VTKKRREIPQRKAWQLSRKQLAVFSLVCVVAIAAGSTILLFLQQSPNNHFSLKAAIVDQLGGELPNPTFRENVKAVLEEYGFSVSYYDEPDVEFFKGLARNNYGIIVLRVHSALRNDNSTVDFFTSEPFNIQRHVQERYEELVVEAVLNYTGTEKHYFAITPKFVEKLEGNFPKSIVIAMGCWSLKEGLKQMAEAFIKREAKAYVGWSDLVDISHVDNETTKLIRRLLVENKTLEQAVNEASRDPFFFSKQRYYPESAGNLRLSDLVKETKATGSSLTAAILSYCCNIAFAVVDSSHKKLKGLKWTTNQTDLLASSAA
jgi:hypothetical protein